MRHIAFALAAMVSMSRAACAPPLDPRHGGARPLGFERAPSDRSSLRALRVRGGAEEKYRTADEVKSIILDAISDNPSGDFQVALGSKRPRSKKDEPVTLAEARAVETRIVYDLNLLTTQLISQDPPAASRLKHNARTKELNNYIYSETELGRSLYRLHEKLYGAMKSGPVDKTQRQAFKETKRQAVKALVASDGQPHPIAAEMGLAPFAFYNLKRKARANMLNKLEKEKLSFMAKKLKRMKEEHGQEQGRGLGQSTSNWPFQTAAFLIESDVTDAPSKHPGRSQVYTLAHWNRRLGLGGEIEAVRGGGWRRKDCTLEYQTIFYVNQMLGQEIGVGNFHEQREERHTAAIKAEWAERTIERRNARPGFFERVRQIQTGGKHALMGDDMSDVE